MIRFVRGNVKPDTPLLYLLPIFGVLLLILIWSALSDYLASEHDRVVRNAVSEAASHAKAYERSTGQLLRAIDQAARLIQHEFERSQQGRDPFDLAAVAKSAFGPNDPFSLVAVVDRAGNVTALSSARANASPSWRSALMARPARPSASIAMPICASCMSAGPSSTRRRARPSSR